MSEINPTSANGDLPVMPGRHIDPVTMLTAVFRGKRTILVVGLLCAVLAALASLRLHPRFTASVEIMPPQMSRGGAAASMLSQMNSSADVGFGSLGSVLQAKNQADTFVAILGAWPIKDTLVKRFDLVHGYHAKTEEEARQILGSRTAIKASKEGLIVVTVTDANRKLSAELANGYVDALRDFMHGLALSEASQRRAFYESQLAKTKNDLAVAEVNFKQIQQSTGMISLDTQAKTLIDSATALRSEITAKEVELEGFRAYSTESNPQVEMAETQLAALRNHLAQVESSNQGGYTGGALSNVPQAELGFVRANRELKYQEGLYDLLVKQYEGSRIDEAREAPVIQVIEPAFPPERKSGPHRVLITLEGFIAGVFLALVIILYRFWRSELTPADVARWAELRKAIFRWSK